MGRGRRGGGLGGNALVLPPSETCAHPSFAAGERECLRAPRPFERGDRGGTSGRTAPPLGGSRVEKLLVEVGDRVEAGQIVAILDTRDRRAALVDEAKAKVEVARAKVAQVQAGAKPEEVRAQEAMIRRSKVDLVAAREDLERARRLIQRNAMSLEELTSRRLKSSSRHRPPWNRPRPNWRH
ncbi:MAG: biotin/lipoyl-binding protein [Isosphaeraceae bacterium]|nr:biotin/lipoyl-binding protein [Isosphaeraceae bacterium]